MHESKAEITESMTPLTKLRFIFSRLDFRVLIILGVLKILLFPILILETPR